MSDAAAGRFATFSNRLDGEPRRDSTKHTKMQGVQS